MTISGQKTQVGFNKLQVQRLHVSQSSPLGISSSPRVEGHMTLHAGQLPLIIILNRVANPGIYYLLSSFSHLSILDKKMNSTKIGIALNQKRKVLNHLCAGIGSKRHLFGWFKSKSAEVRFQIGAFCTRSLIG